MAVTLNNAASGRSSAGGGGGIADAMTSAVVGSVREIRAEDDTPLICISANAPDNGDGRPNDTVYIQLVAP